MVNKGRKRAIPKGSNLETIAFVSAKEAALQKETQEKIKKLQEDAKKKLEEQAKIQKMKEMEEELEKVKLEKEKLENLMEYKPVQTKDNPVYGHFLDENPDIEVKVYDEGVRDEGVRNEVPLKDEEPAKVPELPTIPEAPEEINLGEHNTEMSAFQASLQDFFKDVPVVAEKDTPQVTTQKVEKIITPPIESKPQNVEAFNDNLKQMVEDRNRNLTPQHFKKEPVVEKAQPQRQQEIISPIQGRNVAVVGRGRAVTPISRVASRVAK